VSVLGAIQLILLAGFSFALLFGCLASCASPLVLSATASWSPEGRHRALLLTSIAPAALPAFSVLAVLAPSFLASIWPEYDHCLQHDDHHVHVCLVHLPRQLGNAASCFVLILSAGWLSARAARALVELYRAWRCASQLRAHGRGDPTLGANVLPTPAPLCFIAGVFRPTLFLSRGLLERVAPEQLAVILHHERAHAARRDILLRIVAQAATVFMWPSARVSLLRGLDLAAEQSCDEVAAAIVDDRLRVAETILRVERLLQKSTSRLAPLSVAFGGDTVPQRVAALLEARKRSGSALLILAGFAALSCTVLAASTPLHHLTESLLEALVH
jgi:Zn-dependent protease with chaperone function